MPARRELHTGRYNFLHRSWGPLEPFDDSMPEILKKHGTYTHLVSDHQHYWEDGGCTYHHRYNTWDFIRGQEGDRWKARVRDPEIPDHYGRMWRQDIINREHVHSIKDMPLHRVFESGFEFLDANRGEDNWLMHIEPFDPHEPFHSDPSFQVLYPEDYDGPVFDWPDYKKVTEPPEAIQHCRRQYKALLTQCDHYLGTLLDYFDANDMWKDTMLVVATDHGFLLSEHECWGKCVHPFYNEVAHVPLFIHDPRHPSLDGARRSALVQTIDIAPTLLGFFGADIPPDMQGANLEATLLTDAKVRDAALFGLHGGHVNITDGRYVYMRDFAPGNAPLYNYTQMPTHMRELFSVEEMRTAVMSPPLPFTKGTPVMKIAVPRVERSDVAIAAGMGSKLYDLAIDPGQQNPIDDPTAEARMIALMRGLMEANDAPEEQYGRLGLA
jgi:arylsulfatase A-like enzyme